MKGVRLRRVAVFGTVIVTGTVLAWIYREELDLAARARRTVEFFRAAGPVPFFAAMALLPSFGFPLSFFTLAAGPVFGATWGVAGVIGFSLLAVMLNAAFSYWVAASALRPWVVRFVRWFGVEVPEVQPHAAWPVIVVLRIVPGIPFWVQSYTLGLARVPFRAYMIVSTVIPAGYIAATILLGDGLRRRDPWAIGIAGVLFFAVGTGLHFLRLRYAAEKRARAAAAVESPK